MLRWHLTIIVKIQFVHLKLDEQDEQVPFFMDLQAANIQEAKGG